MSSRLGIIRHGYAQPLFEGLAHPTPDSPVCFDLIHDTPSQITAQLLQDNLEGAFLSPIEYARNNSSLRMINGICISSQGESKIIELHFHENLHTFGTLALNPEHVTETILAKIILAEKYDASPQLIAVQAISKEVLQKNDSVLVVGDECIDWIGHKNKLDFVDEWFDLTELPFIHGFWGTKEGKLTQLELDRIRSNKPPEEEMGQQISYAFDDTASASLDEFYRMAYYYGILKEIPEKRMIE